VSERRPQTIVLAFRVLLLLLAASAVAGALVMTRDGTGSDGGDEVRFVCPMHPEVRAIAPGSCPICGMDLEPLGAAAPAAVRPSAFQTYEYVRRRGF
jgi:hypothetical protein